MREGLEEFLKRIEEKPTNETLIDRFMTLMMEEDSFNRTIYLRKLVTLLLNANPYYALRAAALELQEARKDKNNRESELAALRDVEASFIKLGKMENAQLIAEEINKLVAELGREKESDQAKGRDLERELDVAKATPPRKTEIKLPQRPSSTLISRPIDLSPSSSSHDEEEAKSREGDFQESYKEDREEEGPQGRDHFNDAEDVAASEGTLSGDAALYIPQTPQLRPKEQGDDEASLFYDPRHLGEADLPQRKQSQSPILSESPKPTPLELPSALALTGREFGEQDEERTEMMAPGEKAAQPAAPKPPQPLAPLAPPELPTMKLRAVALDELLPPKPAVPPAPMPNPFALPPSAAGPGSAPANPFSAYSSDSSLETRAPIKATQVFPTESESSDTLNGPLPLPASSPNFDSPLWTAPPQKKLVAFPSALDSEDKGARWDLLRERLILSVGSDRDQSAALEFVKTLYGKMWRSQDALWMGQASISKFLAASEKEENQLHLLCWLFEGLPVQAMQQLWTDLQLQKAGAAFFAIHIEHLAAQGEPRRALNLIRAVLSPDLDAVWFQLSYPALQRLWNSLHLSPWHWSPAEGSEAFCSRLAQRELPLPAVALSF